jgi:hypothetical protein
VGLGTESLGRMTLFFDPFHELFWHAKRIKMCLTPAEAGVQGRMGVWIP